MINKYITQRHAIKGTNIKMTNAGSQVNQVVNNSHTIEETKSTTP